MPVLRPLHFMGEITRVPAFVRLLDNLVSESEPGLKGNKAEALKRGMIELNAIMPIVQAARASGLPDGNPLETYLQEELDRQVQQAVDEEFASYRTWLLSSGLVLVVAFLDSFLDEVVRSVLEHDPRRLLSSTKDRSVDLKDILDAEDLGDLIEAETDRVARRIAFMNLKDRLVFMEKRLGVPIREVLTWQDFTEDGQALLASWDLDRFAEVHEWRHEVAHQGRTTSLTSIDQLSTISEVFARFVMSIALRTRKAFNIPFDFEVNMARWGTSASGSQSPSDGPIV